MKNTKKSTSTDTELFAAYARTAPLGDLRFYLRIAERKLAEFEYPDNTLRAIADMRTLEHTIVTFNQVGTPALKKHVWALIDRYKTSVPEWYGHAGVAGAWVDAIDSASFYFSVQRDAMIFERTKKVDGNDVIVSERHEGPVPAVTIVDAHREASKLGEELATRRVPRRPVPLTVEEVEQLIASVTPATNEPAPAPVRIRKPKAAAAVALACPTCSAPLLPIAFAPNTWGCAGCKETWFLTRKVERAKVERPARQPRTLTAEGTKICTKCETEKPREEFCPGKHERSICSACRRAYRQTLAASKRAA